MYVASDMLRAPVLLLRLSTVFLFGFRYGERCTNYTTFLYSPAIFHCPAVGHLISIGSVV